MQRRTLSAFIPYLIVCLMIVTISGCQRARTPDVSILPSSTSSTQQESDNAPKESPSQPAQNPTDSVIVTETEIAYPQPISTEVNSTIGTDQLTAYPPALPTQTQIQAGQPQRVDHHCFSCRSRRENLEKAQR